LIRLRRNVLQPVFIITVVTVVALTVEILMGAPSIINGIFGYDSIRGARYFGIGNEAMSMLVASSLLMLGIMLEKYKTKWMLLFGFIVFLLVTILIGFPGLGTNTDGPITTVAAFCTMALVTVKSKNKARNVVITVFAMVLALSVFGAYDIMTGPKTHIGKSILLIFNGGFIEVIMIASRKLAVNYTVFRYSNWTPYLIFAVTSLIVFLKYKPEGLMRRVLEQHKGIASFISASIIAGSVGFAFNDSGILIPAIIMSYAAPTILYLMIWEQQKES
jgi:hypothetical protein